MIKYNNIKPSRVLFNELVGIEFCANVRFTRRKYYHLGLNPVMFKSSLIITSRHQMSVEPMTNLSLSMDDGEL